MSVSSTLSPHRSPRLRRFAERLTNIKISLDPPSPPFLSPSPLGDFPVDRRMNYLQVPGAQIDDEDLPPNVASDRFDFAHGRLHSPPPDRRTSFASTMSDNSSMTIPTSSSYQNLLSPMWSTVKYSSDDNETPPNEPVRRSKSAQSNRSSSDCINVPPIIFSPILSRPLRSLSPTMSMSPTNRNHHGSDSESDTGAVFSGVHWRGGSGSLMIPRRSFHHQSSHNDSADMSTNFEQILKRNRRKTMAIHGVELHGEGSSAHSSSGLSSSSMTNLCRIRSSLGHSDPQLSSSSSFNASPGLHPKMVGTTTSRSSINRPGLHASTSPVTLQRCRSPMRLPQRSTSSSHNFGPSTSAASSSAVPITLRTYSTRTGSSLMAPSHDTRRWSLASLPSTSGYGTPGTGSNSGVSSQYSSSEQIGEMVDNMRLGCAAPIRQNTHRYDSNDSYEEGSGTPLNNSWLNRPRSRSLTSPMKFMNEYNLEMVNRTNVYKERFPKAKLQMEERLGAFVADNGPLSGGFSHTSESGALEADNVDDVMMRSRRSTVLDAESFADRSLLRLIGDGATRFLHHQIVEIAADCLAKSKDDLITCSYFCEMSQRLEETINEAQVKTCPESLEYLSKLVKKLLMIVSRPARLLECLEFDPDEFYHLLSEAEGVVREQLGSGTARVPDLPQYIIGKLGLDRDPLDATENVDPPEELVKNETSKGKWPDTNRAPCEDDFDTIRLVSNGAYGAVYLVRHRESRQRFALKKMNKQTLMLRNQVDQVFAERDILTMADNPFVVSFYGSFETRQYLCMLLEYVEGGDCAALLKSAGTLPVELTRLYVAETILAIEYLHSYGIVHRDLKPDNLLITAMGHIKLTDFGLSKIGLMNRTTLVAEGYETVEETQQFQDKQLCGTPEYIAPEVILRRGYGKPVDWWALGIILYEFLVGIVPFFGETPEILFSKVISENVEYPTDDEALLPEAEDLCQRLLEKNPSERLGTLNGAQQLMAHPFFALLDFTSLLRQKAEFVPQLENDEDTSYFDTRADRYNHEAESCAEDDSTSMMFHSFSTASPRHSIVSIDPAHLPHLLSSTSSALSSPKDIERSNSVSSSPRIETRPERSYSTGQASLLDENTVTAVNLRRRFSAQRRNVSTTSSSGTGSGTCFATAASSTDSSVDATSLPAITRSESRKSPLPRFAISCEGSTEKSMDEERKTSDEQVRFRKRESNSRTPSQLQLVIPSISSQSSDSSQKEQCYVIGNQPITSCQLSPGGASVSSTSSTDIASPHHAQIESSKEAPTAKIVTMCKGPLGFGFTLKSVRVYLGEHSEYYTIEHIVTAVVDPSPAFDAGLRAEDMITHVNGQPVHNLTHPQLMHKLLRNGNELVLKLTPLSATSIKEGAARRTIGKMAKKKPKRPQRRVPLEKKSRKPSALLRRLSGKGVNNDIVPGSSSQKQAFMPRSASSQDGCILPGKVEEQQQQQLQQQHQNADNEENRPYLLRGPSSPANLPSCSSTTPSSIPVVTKRCAKKNEEIGGGGIAIVKQKSQSIAVSPLARDSARMRSPSPSHRSQTTYTTRPDGISANASPRVSISVSALERSPVLSTRRRSYQPTTGTSSASSIVIPTVQTSRGFSAAAQSAQNLLNRILPRQQQQSQDGSSSKQS